MITLGREHQNYKREEEQRKNLKGGMEQKKQVQGQEEKLKGSREHRKTTMRIGKKGARGEKLEGAESKGGSNWQRRPPQSGALLCKIIPLYIFTELPQVGLTCLVCGSCSVTPAQLFILFLRTQ